MSDVLCQITATLLEAVKREEKDSCMVLVGHIQRQIRRILGSGPDAEDVAQETFMKIFLALQNGNFDPDARGNPASWVLKIAIRNARDARRRRNVRDRISDSSIDVDEVVDERSCETETNPEPSSRRTALATLSEDQWHLLELRWGYGYTEVQVAGILDLPVGTVKSRCFRARADLRRVREAGGTLASRGGA